MDDVAAFRVPLGQAQRTIHPVILSGGVGTRLWPLSRRDYPKQLLPLVAEQTMLQQTVARTSGSPEFAAPLVICHQEHRFLVAEQLKSIGVQPRRIVLEPIGRNTGPALVVAALILSVFDRDAVMLAQPSDHHITDPDAFSAAVDRAMELAARGYLTTFGIVPTRPETGYGYIEQGRAVDGTDGAFVVRSFVEKPDQATAKSYVDGGRHHWNSGMFLLPVATFLDEVRRHQPEMLKICAEAISQGHDDLDFFRLDEAAFTSAPNMSIDKAIMELTDQAAVVPVDMGWSDIGSWQALHGVRAADGDGNVIEGDVALDGVRNSYIRSGKQLVAALGVENLIIVATDDAVLVADAAHSQDVGKLVQRLHNRAEVQQHCKVYRPWGSYQTIDVGDRFQVKRITVNPGGKLSLQMHHHRAEHWVVVHGTARVTCGDKSWLLHENQSTYIPLGTTHRLENPGMLPLDLIEVQSGPYLGEDDIVRYEDTYGRH